MRWQSTVATITYGAVTETPIVLDLSVSGGMCAGYYGGLDVCYDPRNSIDDTVKAYLLTFGNNIGGYYGYDYYWYAWNIKFNKKRNSFGELAYEI